MTETDLVDACVAYVEREMKDQGKQTTTQEAFRNAQNALMYVCFGEEDKLAYVVEPEFINKDGLPCVVDWAAGYGLDDRPFTHQRLETIREYLKD